MLVRSPLEAARVEIREMSRYCTLLERELCAANERARKAEANAALCRSVAQGLLWARQLETSTVFELLEDMALRPLDARARKLVYNVRQALRCA